MKKAKADQWFRRIVQASILLLVLTTPFLVQYRVLLANNGIENLRQQNPDHLSNRIYLALDYSIRKLSDKNADSNSAAERGKTVEKLEKVRGNVWSAEIFGLSLTDPLGGLESIFASKAATLTLWMAMLIPLVATMLLGRVFCSWMCPAGFIFEMADKLRHLLARIGIPLRSVSFETLNKYTLLTAGLVCAFFAGLPLLGHFYPPAILGRVAHQAADAQFYPVLTRVDTAGTIWFSGAASFLVFIILIEVVFARRMWCRYFCPGGALYALLGWRRFIRIGNETSRCTHCAECIRVCPMGLNPMKPDPGLECDNCLVCLTACEPGSLTLKFRLKRIKTEGNQVLGNGGNPSAKVPC